VFVLVVVIVVTVANVVVVILNVLVEVLVVLSVVAVNVGLAAVVEYIVVVKNEVTQGEVRYLFYRVYFLPYIYRISNFHYITGKNNSPFD
jgi:hypothetical protein